MLARKLNWAFERPAHVAAALRLGVAYRGPRGGGRLRRQLRPRLQSVPHLDQGLGELVRSSSRAACRAARKQIATPSAVPETGTTASRRGPCAPMTILPPMSPVREAPVTRLSVRGMAPPVCGPHQRARLLVAADDRVGAQHDDVRVGQESRASPDCRPRTPAPACPSRRRRRRRVTGPPCRRPRPRPTSTTSDGALVPRQRRQERIAAAAQAQRQPEPRADSRRWRPESRRPPRPRSRSTPSAAAGSR